MESTAPAFFPSFVPPEPPPLLGGGFLPSFVPPSEPTLEEVHIKVVPARGNTVKTQLEAIDDSRVRIQLIFKFCNDGANEQNGEQRMTRFFGSTSAIKIYAFLWQSLVTWPRAWKKAIVEDWCISGFIDFIGDSFIYLNSPNPVISVAIPSPKEVLFRITLSYICDCTDGTLNAGKILAKKGIIPLLVNCITDPEVKDNLDDREIEDQTTIALSTIHNMAKLSEFKSQFEEAGALDALKFFFSYPNEKMQMSAFCAAACLLAETEIANDLLDDYAIIPKLVDCLHAALVREDHTSEGFSAEEIVESLGFLAVNDNNKGQIVKYGAISALSKMLEPRSDGDVLEQERSVDCLWTLAFNEDIRKRMKEADEICRLLTEISLNSPDESLKMKAERARDFINLGKGGLAKILDSDKDSDKEKVGNKLVPNKRDEQHVFISYSWKQQQIVLRIRQLLLDAGYRVWLDVDRMRGSTLEAMASAVENAFVVLICYSDNYRLSNMCRCEAEYVFKLEKPFIPINLQYRYQPTGWLGIIIGARLYIDFSIEKHPFDKMAQKLLAEIGEFSLADNDDEVEEIEMQTPRPMSVASMETPQNKNHAVEIEHEFEQNEAQELKIEAKYHQTKEAGKSQISVTENSGGGFNLGPGCQRCKLLEALVAEKFAIDDGEVSFPLDLAENDPFEQRSKKDLVRAWSNEDVIRWLGDEGLSHLTAGPLGNFDGQALLGLREMKFSAIEFYYKTLMQILNDSFIDCVKITASLENLMR